MKFSKIYAVFVRQWFLIKSNPARLVGTFIWTFLSLLQWGFISRYLETFGGATFSFVTVILGAVILWEFMGRMEQGVMMSFLEDIWSRNFINYFASPLKVGEYLAGLVVTSVATGAVGMLFMAILAGMFFGYNILKLGLFMLPFLAILFIFGIAVGIFIAAIIFRFGPAAEWIGWPIPFVLSIVAGVFYPVSTLPDFLQMIAGMLPSAYVFESMRSILQTGVFTALLGRDLAIGFILAMVYLSASYFFFLSVYRYNVKSGGIARFGANM